MTTVKLPSGDPGVVGTRVAQEGAYTAFLSSSTGGIPQRLSPSLLDILPFLAYWLAPQEARRHLRGLLRRRPGTLARPVPLDKARPLEE